jgi:hypothetical protein
MPVSAANKIAASRVMAPRNRVSFRDITVIFGNHDRNPVSLTPATKPRNRVSFRDITVIFGNQPQKPGFFNPTDQTPKPHPETGFLFGILQLSLETNHRNPVSLTPPTKPRNRVSFRDITVIFVFHHRNPVSLTPATKPRNLTQKPGFFSGYYSYLWKPTTETRFLLPHRPNPETGVII